MVKSGGRSKGARDRGSGGGGGGNGGAGSSPPSPTRRLKKGGKRGRRLCHKDGCTLCPSFGFEGDVAVSCSHHKEEGMRNLTARRCQHEGCFTVANFGMPGDKPGFCAAHSTDGMVNRNKPRGGEGMLMTVARSSRRAAKANTAILEAEAAKTAEGAAGAAAAKAEEMAAAAGRGRSSSGGKDLLMRAAVTRKDLEAGYGDDGYGASRILGTRARSGGARPRLPYQGGPDDVVGKSNGMDSSRRQPNGARRGHHEERTAGSGAGPAGSGASAAFVARGDGRDSVAAGPSRKGVDSGKGGGGGGGGRLRSRGGGKRLGGAAVTAGVLGRPEAYLTSSRGDADDYHRRYGVGRTAVDVSFPGDFRGSVPMDGPFLMDGPGLDNGNVGAPLGLGMSGGLEEILGVDSDTLDAKAKVAESFAARGSSGMVHSSIRAMRTAGSSGLGGPSIAGTGSGSVGSVIGCGAGLSGGGGVDFELDNMPELDSMDLAGLRAVETGADIGRSARQIPQRTAMASSRAVSILGPRYGGGSTLASCSVTDVSAAPSSSSSGTITSPVAAAAAAAVAAVRSTPSSTQADALVPAKLPSEDAWWEVLEGEDFVAMPEPIWGVPLDAQSMPEDASRAHEDHRGWRGMKPSASAGPSVGGGYQLGGGSNGTGVGTPDGPGPKNDPTKNRSLLSSSPSLGGVLTMSDDDGYGGEGRRGDGRGNGVVAAFSPLSGACRLAEDGGGGGGGGARMSPAKKRHRMTLGETHALPTHYSASASTRPSKRELQSSLIFSSAVSNASHAVHPGAPVGFGLSVMPYGSGPLSPATQLQANAPSPMAIGNGSGVSMRSSAIGHGAGGGSLGKVWGVGDSWMSGDAVSPSKRLSLSPAKYVSASPSTSSRPLLAQSTPPWGAGGLCPPRQQTQAAGRA